MNRALKVAALIAISILAIATFLDSELLKWRDLYLYNFIWISALAIVITAPITVHRLVVATFALAIALWGCGSLFTSIAQFESGSESTFTELFYIAFYPLILIAIPFLSGRKKRLTPLEILDALIFSLGATSLVAAGLYLTLFRQFNFETPHDFLLLFYPIGDIALILIASLQMIHGAVSRRLALFTFALLLFTAADLLFLYQRFSSQYSFGGVADLGWLFAILLLSITATLPQSEVGTSRAIPPSLIALSIFLSPILLAVSALNPQLFPQFIVIPSIANLLLALIRMNTALQQSRTLADERALARTDELTGLPNRRRLMSELKDFSTLEGALLLLDLNGFKPINDQFGHEIGDKVLREVSRRFTHSLPEGAILARLGGDEFGAIIPGRFPQTVEAAYALRASLSYPLHIDGREIHVGVSIGVVHNDGAGNLLKRADDAMYRAKSSETGVVHS